MDVVERDTVRLAILSLVTAATLVVAAFARLARPMPPGREPCPRPDAGGMAQRLADRFFRMSQDSLQRRILVANDIDPAQVTPPLLISDEKLCGRIAATFGLPVPGAAEGGVFYASGPYIIYSPWRDYSRRAEWLNKTEFVALLVLDKEMKVVGAFGM